MKKQNLKRHLSCSSSLKFRILSPLFLRASNLELRAYFKRGFSLVEVIIGTALIVLSLTGLITAYAVYLKAGFKNTENLKAAFLLQEGVEAVTLIRDNAWSNLSSLVAGTWYYLSWNGSEWGSTSTATTTDSIFTRTFKLDDAYRKNSGQDIVDVSAPDAKTLDADAKRLTVRVIVGTLSTTTVSFAGGTTDASLGSFPSNNAGDGDVGQSFTTGASGVTTNEIELYLKRISNPSNVYLEIRSGSTVGSIIASSTAVASTTIPTSALSWVKFSFASAPTLAANTTYYLRLRSTPDSTVAFSGSSGTLNWGYLQTASSPYAGGQAYRYVGRLNNPSDQGQALSQYDFAFKVNSRGDATLDKQVVTYLTNLFE